MRVLLLTLSLLLLTSGCTKKEFKTNFHNIHEGTKRNFDEVKDATKDEWHDVKSSVSKATSDYAKGN